MAHDKILRCRINAAGRRPRRNLSCAQTCNSFSFSLALHQAQIKALKRLLGVSNLVNRNSALDEQPHHLIGADPLVQGDELAVALASDELPLAKFLNRGGEIPNLEPDPSFALFCGGQGTFEDHSSLV